MSPFKHPISPAMLLMILAAGVSSAAIVPITGVQAGANRKPPYTLEGLTADDFTITREFLVLGQSSGSAFLGSDIRYADDFDLNTVASRTASGIWRVTKLGGLDTYSDTNGEAPDFFVFEAGMNDPLTVRAILSDGSLGKTITIAASAWGNTGLDRLGILNGFQSIGGVAFATTDLLDASGLPLASDAVIRGLQFDSPDVDPVHFSAAMVAPEPATLAILSLGGLLAMRRRS